MELYSSLLAASLVRYILRAVRSVLSDEKKLSIAALSHTLPERLIEQTTPLSTISRWNCALVYWAESSGRRNGLVGRSEKFVKCLCGRFPFECLARPCIEGCRHGGDRSRTAAAS